MWQAVTEFIAHTIQVVIILALIVVFGAQIIADTKRMYKSFKEDEENGKDNSDSAIQ